MKKIYTFAIAMMTCLSLLAADFEPTSVYRIGDETTLGAQWKSVNQTANFFEVADTIVFSPFVLYQSAAAGWQEWTGCAGSGSSATSWDPIEGRCFQGSAAMFSQSSKCATTRSTRTYFYHVTNCSQVMALVKSSNSITLFLHAIEMGTTDTLTASYKSGSVGVVSLEGLDAAKTYRIVVTTDYSSSNASFYEIAFVGPQSTDPVLNVSSESLIFEATAANPNPSATVTFTGKNLTAGTYDLTTPSQSSSWTVNPTQVTVGGDGKLNETITVTYAGNELVESETSSISLTINNITKTVALNATSDMTKYYISGSVNIEGLIVEHGKGYAIKPALTAANIEYRDIDALDSLNNSKGANRNEEYLGLKIKKAGGYIAGWLQAGHTISVKFGEVKDDVKVNGTVMSKTILKEAPIEFTATEDTYVKIETTTASTVVIKQIMLDAPVEDVMYKITYAASEHGSVSGWTIAFPNEEVFLTYAPESGYIVMHSDFNGTEIIGLPGIQESFIMPAAHVTVTTVFDLPNAIDEISQEPRANKLLRNGQLLIEQNGVLYNAQGAVVK